MRQARVDRPLIERVVAPSVVQLPVVRGQRLGEVRVYDGSRLVAASASFPVQYARSASPVSAIRSRCQSV